MPVVPLLLVLHLSDPHSALDAYPALLGTIDQVMAEHPEVETRILIGGDVFEHGDPVAQRSKGAGDWALVKALVKRAPVVWLLGNHDGDLEPYPDVVRKARTLGVVVVGTLDLHGAALAPDRTILPGGVSLLAASTPDFSTYPKALRSRLKVRPAPLDGHDKPVVLLSHLGVDADLALVPRVPRGSLILGAHDHRRLIRWVDGRHLAHSGAFGQGVTVGLLDRRGWKVTWRPVPTADAALSKTLHSIQHTHLTDEDRRCVGVSPKQMDLEEAAEWAAEALRKAVGTDLAVLNHTSFGSGLPAGPVSRYQWNRFLRFDNALKRGAVTRIPTNIRLHRSTAATRGRGPWTLATTGWVASKSNVYLGKTTSGPFRSVPKLTLRAALQKALLPCP